MINVNSYNIYKQNLFGGPPMIFKHVKGSGTKKFEKHWFQRKEGFSCAGTYTGLPPSALAKTQAQCVSNLASYFWHMAYPASGYPGASAEWLVTVPHFHSLQSYSGRYLGAMVLNQASFHPPRDIWQCVESFFIVTSGWGDSTGILWVLLSNMLLCTGPRPPQSPTCQLDRGWETLP